MYNDGERERERERRGTARKGKRAGRQRSERGGGEKAEGHGTEGREGGERGSGTDTELLDRCSHLLACAKVVLRANLMVQMLESTTPNRDKEVNIPSFWNNKVTDNITCFYIREVNM